MKQANGASENMRRSVLLSVAIHLMTPLLHASPQTMASLPNGLPISVAPSNISNAIQVQGLFKDQEEIRRAVVGNWVTATYRVVYRACPVGGSKDRQRDSG